MRISRILPAAESYGIAWFNKNLNFGCTQCGKCCTSINVNKYNNKSAGMSFISRYSIIDSFIHNYDLTKVETYSSSVYINEAEGKAISNSLKLTKKEFYSNYTKEIEDENGDLYTTLISKPSKSSDPTSGSECIFLDDKKCSIYSVRPTQCRTYPFWPSIMSESEWNSESKLCEGIDRTGDNSISKDAVLQNMIIHEIHNRGNGENWSYDESMEYLQQSILNEPEILRDYEKEFFKVKDNNITIHADDELSVIDNMTDSTRRLEFSKSSHINQTEVRVDPVTRKINHNEIVMPVHQVIFDIMTVLSDPIDSILLVGGGGLSLSSYISNHERYRDTSIDVIEPNANVISIAKRFFDPIINGKILISTGEDVLTQLKSQGAAAKNYEVIIIDAFANNEAPPVAFLEESNIKNLLHLLHKNIRNSVIINVYGDVERKNRVVSSLREHLNVDYNINVLVVTGGDSDRNNYVLFISNKKLDAY